MLCRNKKWGGLMVFTKKYLITRRIKELESTKVEITSLESRSRINSIKTKVDHFLGLSTTQNKF